MTRDPARPPDPASAAASVRVERLTFAHPDGTMALRGVDLEVAAGERVAVLGPNGAGKSTLVLHLNGILRPQSGSVSIGGVEVGPATVRAIRRRVGIVFQDPDDQLFMPTVRDDVAFGPANAGVRGAELDATIDAALDAVGMAGAERAAPHHLSVGERRRVAIATVLATHAEVLVLDEPTANLDPAARRDLVEVLDRTTATMLVVTHDLLFAAETCTRAVLLDGGRVVADGPTLELLRDEATLARHRLFLPRGFDPARI